MTTRERDAAFAGVLRPAAPPAGAAERILRGARRRLEHLERIRKEFVCDATERGIVAIRPGTHGVATGRAGGVHAEHAREELREYLDGRRVYFSVPVDLAALAPFQRSVLEAAARIPFGETRSYSSLAAAIGSKGASRAVGTALGRNPVPFIVPCHRVLRGDRTLGGYAFGLPMKADLLELERTTPVLEGCSSTRIVCRVGCPALARAREDRRVVFAGVADARSVGYRPCRVCRPEAA
jgi:O-6-methylguanine DNA methyltransferase